MSVVFLYFEKVQLITYWEESRIFTQDNPIQLIKEKQTERGSSLYSTLDGKFRQQTILGGSVRSRSAVRNTQYQMSWDTPAPGRSEMKNIT